MKSKITKILLFGFLATGLLAACTNKSGDNTSTSGDTSSETSGGGETSSEVTPAEFPAAEVQAFLTAQSIEHDTIPALDGADDYEFESPASYSDAEVVVMFATAATRDSAYTTYMASLGLAGYSLGYEDGYGDEHYVTTYAELDVCVWKGSSNPYLFIDFSKITYKDLTAAFPATDVAAIVLDKFEITTAVPAMQNAVKFTIDSEGATTKKIQVEAEYSNAIEAFNKLDAYKAIVLAAGYTENGADSYGDMHYLSADTNLEICPWVYMYDSGEASIILDLINPNGDVYPATEVQAYLTENEITDTIPVFDANVEEVSFSAADGQLMFTPAGETTVAQLITAYQAALTTASYTSAGADEYGDLHFQSPNGQIDLCAWSYYGVVMFVDIVLQSN